MTDTPRTDALGGSRTECWKLAETLERELAAVKHWHDCAIHKLAAVEQRIAELEERNQVQAQRIRSADADYTKLDRRLDWLLGKISGAEYRRIGITYDDRYSLLDAIDTALKERGE